MSYEQHEWVNGETITAAKMNNIEEGIVEASQGSMGGIPIMHFVAHTGVSYETWFVSWRYAKKVGNKYEPVDMNASPYQVIAGAYGGDYYMVAPYPVPNFDGLYLIIARDNSYSWAIDSTSGNISEPITITVNGYDDVGYIITGDFEIEATFD